MFPGCQIQWTMFLIWPGPALTLYIPFEKDLEHFAERFAQRHEAEPPCLTMF